MPTPSGLQRGRRRDAPVGAARRHGRGRGGRGRGGRLGAAPSRRGRAGRGRRERLLQPAEVERAEDYRSGQRLLYVGGVAAQGALLVLLDHRPAGPAAPRSRARRRAARARAAPRPPRGCSGRSRSSRCPSTSPRTSAPSTSASRRRTWAPGWGTRAKATGISAAIAAGVGTGLLALIRRSPDRWWIPGSAALVALAAAFTWLAPVVLAPPSTTSRSCRRARRASDVLELGRRRTSKSARSTASTPAVARTALNAYVGGLGPTKRVVLYDTLLDDSDRGERRSVVAHELGHVHGRDIPRGLLFVAISAPLGLLFASRLSAGRSAAARAPSRGSRPRCRRWRAGAGGDLVRDRRGRQPALARRSRPGPTPSRWS